MPFNSIRRKFFFGVSALALLLGLLMVVFAQTVIRRKLVDMLQETGVAIARKVANDAVNSVITEHYFEVTMMLKDLQAADESFVYGFVVDEEGRELAHTFDESVPPGLKEPHPKDPVRPFVRELSTDKGPVLDVSVPLLRGQIGELHLGLSLTAIRRDVNEIVLLMLSLGVVLLLAGIAVSTAFARVITRPLLTLAGAAETFGRGETQLPVRIATDDEVGQLARVFNEMMESRKRSEQDQARLIEELRRTLSEVKTLRGFLPICSSCKKIRSDQGYWQQIESYLSMHSDAEFSHGLCPDCAQTLYP
ncbi:MAG: HAMP domain-containing protein, partial [Deltaproteobacteria bacterium]|nr:HAMP domain-containing protein [Deltaproteobacteria bacterium]